jgi:hypothetical protein
MDEEPNTPDKSQVFGNLTEPFMFTVRELNNFNVKVIWWYIAVVDEESRNDQKQEEAPFKAQFLTCEAALEKLTFQTDREVLRNAIRLLEGTPCI